MTEENLPDIKPIKSQIELENEANLGSKTPYGIRKPQLLEPLPGDLRRNSISQLQATNLNDRALSVKHSRNSGSHTSSIRQLKIVGAIHTWK